jgi:phosphoribosylanthranilate isomerase
MTDQLKIKVCGMRDPQNLEEVCGLGPDFIGYIFFRGSKRYVGEKPDPVIFEIPENRIQRVGVFVNEPILSVQHLVEKGWLDMVQLHGNESPEYCKALVNEGIYVIKAIQPEFLKDESSLLDYYGVIHYFLFDTPGKGFGGTGLKFNWDLLEQYNVPVPYILSGGIGPGDGEALRELDHMWLHAVDVNSRFETEPGIKSVSQLKDFMKEIRR